MIDHLIVGQGICGTFLSWYLAKAGRSFAIIDNKGIDTASRVAAAIINPVTGRRIVKTWMIDDVMPFAKNAYDEISAHVGVSVVQQKNIIDFFPSPQMRLAFQERANESSKYLSIPEDQSAWRNVFNDDFGFGEISPCLLVDLNTLLDNYRAKVQSNLLEEIFDPRLLERSDDVIRYKDITAGSIVFCDGVNGAINSYFQMLPFAPNKGEVIWIECKDIPPTHIFKNGINVVPWAPDIFWVGSSYGWDFLDDQPTQTFRTKTVSHLEKWLKVPFKLVDHKASVRPATLERRPFIGFHPVYPNVGIFNGMGVKGCSLAPFFAKRFVEHIEHSTPLLPEVDIARFKNLLSKNV